VARRGGFGATGSSRPYVRLATRWCLDIDAATHKPVPWTEPNIMDETAELAELAHRMFRWAIKPEFIQTFGAPDATSDL